MSFDWPPFLSEVSLTIHSVAAAFLITRCGADFSVRRILGELPSSYRKPFQLIFPTRKPPKKTFYIFSRSFFISLSPYRQRSQSILLIYLSLLSSNFRIPNSFYFSVELEKSCLTFSLSTLNIPRNACRFFHPSCRVLSTWKEWKSCFSFQPTPRQQSVVCVLSYSSDCKPTRSLFIACIKFAKPEETRR